MSLAWRGMRLLEGRACPYERAEGHFPRHVLTVNRGGSASFEVALPGRRPFSGATAPGQVNLWPAGMPHSARWLTGGCWLLLEVEPRTVAEVAASLGMPRAPEFRPAVGVADPVAAHLAVAIELEAREGGSARDLVQESLGLALVGHLLEFHARAAPRLVAPARGETLRPARLRLVLEHIETRLDADLSLDELASLAGMDVYAFVRAFKATTGSPPHRYVLQARIERAKSLLHDPGLSISDVAIRTGFATPSHFASTFRRLTGGTPRAWRSGAGRQ